ncbi:MAG: hypothetical protein ACK5L3_14130 [Oscillospiraceae bacterium]
MKGAEEYFASAFFGAAVNQGANGNYGHSNNAHHNNGAHECFTSYNRFMEKDAVPSRAFIHLVLSC